MQSREYQLEIKEIIIFEHKIPNDRHRKNISCDFIENVEGVFTSIIIYVPAFFRGILEEVVTRTILVIRSVNIECSTLIWAHSLSYGHWS